MDRTCKKCGYVNSGNEAEISCPSCGAIYAKVDAAIEARRAGAAATRPALSRRAREKSQPLEFIREKLTTRRAALFFTGGFLALFILGWLYWPTESKKLTDRSESYMALIRVADDAKAYEFLSPATRKNIALTEWEKLLSIGGRPEEDKVRSILFSPDRQSAKLVVVSKLGENTTTETQRWIRVSSNWYRDLSADRAELISSVKEATAQRMREATAKNLRSQLRISSSDPPTTTWYSQTVGSGSDRFRVFPETKVQIKNVGPAPVTWLAIRIEFYEPRAQSILSTHTIYPVGIGDRALEPEEASQLIHVRSAVAYKMDFAGYANTMVNGNTFAEKIETRYFFKFDDRDDWKPMRSEGSLLVAP